MLTAPAQTVKDNGERRLHFSLQDRPGALNGALDMLRKHGLNMSHIESRPSITAENGYDFFVALTSTTATKDALDAVMAELKAAGASDINLLSESKSESNESTSMVEFESTGGLGSHFCVLVACFSEIILFPPYIACN